MADREENEGKTNKIKKYFSVFEGLSFGEK